MAWMSNDFECLNCGEVFEELYQPGDDVLCPACGSDEVEKLLASPRLATYSIASPEQKRDMLMKRSLKHTAKEVAKEPERWGAAGIQRAQEDKRRG